MNLQLKSTTLVSGPERVRSGKEIFLGVEATFTLEGQTFKSIGFAIVEDETAAGMKAAITAATKQAEEIICAGYDPFDSPKIVPATAMVEVAKMASVAAASNAKLKGNTSLAESLEKPADDVQQKQIDQVCGELGITPINVIGLENGSALCMLKALESLLHQAKVNPDGD